jgi:hypothetical protein
MLHQLAYLDLGAGSMLLQMILAGILGASFVIKTYWRRFIGFFSRKPDDEPNEVGSPSADEPR